MLEAMSAGCVVIGSDTPPVREVINGNNGILVPFFDIEQWSDQIINVLENRERFGPPVPSVAGLIQAIDRKMTHHVERI
jgi:glycosyltransferase involved in cell wall biosynthesis